MSANTYDDAHQSRELEIGESKYDLAIPTVETPCATDSLYTAPPTDVVSAIPINASSSGARPLPILPLQSDMVTNIVSRLDGKEVLVTAYQTENDPAPYAQSTTKAVSTNNERVFTDPGDNADSERAIHRGKKEAAQDSNYFYLDPFMDVVETIVVTRYPIELQYAYAPVDSLQISSQSRSKDFRTRLFVIFCFIFFIAVYATVEGLISSHII